MEPTHAQTSETATYASDGAYPRLLHKSPWLAALLSFFPGMGNVYNGLYLRGLTFFLVFVSCITLTVKDEGSPLFGLAIAFTWIFNVLDAYRQAVLINYGYGRDLAAIEAARSPAAWGEKITAGLLLLALGTVAMLKQYFDIELAWLLDLWPVALLALGAWLVWSAMKSRAEEKPSDTSLEP